MLSAHVWHLPHTVMETTSNKQMWCVGTNNDRRHANESGKNRYYNHKYKNPNIFQPRTYFSNIFQSGYRGNKNILFIAWVVLSNVKNNVQTNLLYYQTYRQYNQKWSCNAPKSITNQYKNDCVLIRFWPIIVLSCRPLFLSRGNGGSQGQPN